MLIAHLSDLHLLSLRGVRPTAFLGKRATGGLNLMFNRGGEFPAGVARALIQDLEAQAPDHVVVSGDLTNLAFDGELELARDVLGGLGRAGLTPAEVTVVPGNHDLYTRGAAAADSFGRILASHLTGDLQPGPARFPFVRLRGEVAVVALSTARPSAPLLAVGTLGARQLRQAEALLTAPEVRERFRLVVLHHPPVGQHIRWHNRLTDAAAFAALVRRVGADLIIHGHLHRYCRTALPGPVGSVPVVGVGSATWLSPGDPTRRAQYNLYRIEQRALVEVGRRQLDPGSRTFVALRTAAPG